MPGHRYTRHFEQEVLRKRPYLKREWCVYVVEHAVRSEAPGAQPLEIPGSGCGT
jgi:hypothetical protein